MAKTFAFLSSTPTVLSPESLALPTSPLLFVVLQGFPAGVSFVSTGGGLLFRGLLTVYHSPVSWAIASAKERQVVTRLCSDISPAVK